MSLVLRSAEQKFRLLVFFVVLLMSSLVNAQDEDSSVFDNPNKELPVKEFRPEIGFGLGNYSFRGEIQSKDTRTGFAAPIVFSFYGARRITNSIDLGIRFSRGSLLGYESGPDRYLNFKTALNEGSVYLAYDFTNVISETSKFRPYFTLGFTVYEFNNKGDLYDADGNQYHYWSDGSIMNMPENAPNADEALSLRRDYVYETDLRKANLDNFGRYRQVGFGIPVGLELEVNITKRWSFRMGSVFTYNFGDYLDNVTDESAGSRQGKKGGDHYFHNKLSLHYDLFNYKRRIRPEQFEFVDFLALDTDDEDIDGIINEFDICPFTPFGVEVDDQGCPVDVDQDGVGDYLDIDNGTISGSDVYDNGLAYMDRDYLEWWMRFIDSTDVDEGMASRLAARNRARSPEYRVYLKEYPNGEKISDEEIAKLDQLKDVKALSVPGASVYASGKYSSLETAKGKAEQAKYKGFGEARVVVYEDGRLWTPEEWQAKVDAEIATANQGEIGAKKALEGQYVVSLGSTDAGATMMEQAKFLIDDQVLMFDGENKSVDYVKGPFADTSAARVLVDLLKKQGFDKADVVKISNGKVSPVEKKGEKGEKEDIPDYVKLKDYDGLLVVKVGTINKYTSQEEKDRLQSEDDLIAINKPDGSIDFVHPSGFTEKESAEKVKEEYKKKGFYKPQVATVMLDDQELKLIIEDELDGEHTLLVGKFRKGVPSKEEDKILSIADVKQLHTHNPEMNNYVVGKFKTKEEAAGRMKALIDQGFSPELIKYEGDKITEIDRKEILSSADADKAKENEKNDKINTGEAVFRVQVGAFSKEVSLGRFKGVDVVDMKGRNGLHKYLTEGKTTYEQAFLERNRLKKLGFDDSFIVAYKNGKKVPIGDLITNAEIAALENKHGKGDFVASGKVTYKVQVGAFKDFSAQADNLQAYDNVQMEIYGEYKRILVGNFDAFSKAERLKQVLRRKGYPYAFVVAYDESGRMPAPGVQTSTVPNQVDETPKQQVKGLHIFVQVGLYKDAVPSAVQEKFNQIENLTKQATPQGVTRYLAGDFSSPQDATAYKEKLKALGLTDVFLIAFYNNEKIGIKKAIEIYQSQN